MEWLHANPLDIKEIVCIIRSMEYVDPKGYAIYKDEVLAKADGGNIHKLNTLLGIAVNSIMFMETKCKEQDFTTAEEHRTDARTAQLELYRMTGVIWRDYPWPK